jgi:anti-sigma factor RsiW
VEELDESTLVAFVDGELDAAAAREVARLVAEDPAAQEKVRLLRSSAALVRAAFAKPDWEIVPPTLARLLARPRVLRLLAGRRQFATVIAASLAACVAGFAGGLGLRSVLSPRPGPAERLLDEVAEYHTVYAGHSGGLDIAPASEAPRILAWFADVLGRKLGIPDLASFGLAFHGARLLVVDGRPVTQLLYVEPGAPGHPLGVCITAWPGANKTLATERRDGVSLALWASEGYAYVLVGWMDPEPLRRLAAALRPALEAT